ncbi:MAG: hypothetical protein JWN39_119, partial [Ilumatobacteraceae bacterium]|nr:hypothetical protein [Ilumatobacteraceae bacterium]
NDPILKAWESAFPNLFVDVSKAPEHLSDHFRYPEDLFRVQTAAYARYQLQPTEFFERTGAWSVAQAPSTTPHLNVAAGSDTTLTTDALSSQAADDAGSTSVRFTPYYTMFHPPGSDATGTFSILRPFVPYSKDDSRTELQSFMVASSDPKTYGQLTSYVLTATVDGPLKVAASAESADAISRELTLLNSAGGGSDVSFGDVQLVPIAGGVLYVRPLFVSVNGQANYRKIIVSYNAIAAIDDTIGGALRQLFPGFSADIGDHSTTDTGTTGDGSTSTTPDTGGNTGGTTSTTVPGSDQTPDELLQQAQALFDEADAALAKTPPDYATYGEKQTEARNLISQAISALGGS